MNEQYEHYEGYWIVRDSMVSRFRVKLNRQDDYALHHSSFDSRDKAKEWIDNIEIGSAKAKSKINELEASYQQGYEDGVCGNTHKYLPPKLQGGYDGSCDDE
jgi:hypothetical protein